MNEQHEDGEAAGSWLPAAAVAVLLLARWLAYGKGGLPISFRRWMGLRKVEWRRRLGYRDDARYRMRAGDGSNLKLKRQG